MIAAILRTLLENFSIVMIASAFALAGLLHWARRGQARPSFAATLLGWVLLLSIGIQGIYTFVLHVFFAERSAAAIGWAVSPFQYEVGIADLTVGVLGVLAFWGNFSFRLATAIAGIVWFWGDAVGHVREMVVAHDYAPGNAGSWFWTDVLVPPLLIVLVVANWKREQTGTT